MLFSTAYFPPILQYAWFFKAKKIQIEQFESFTKQSFRNRCQILTANGMQSLSLPVIRPDGAKTLTKDVLVSYDTNWQQLHWRAIKTAYNSSPFLLYYQDDLEVFFSKKYRFLLDLNEAIFDLINDLMEWDLKYERSQTFVFPNETNDLEDKRYLLSPKKEISGVLPTYIQVFSDQYPFIQNLSILDLLFNLGPEAEAYLMKIYDPLMD
jgi:hypothetical protein